MRRVIAIVLLLLMARLAAGQTRKPVHKPVAPPPAPLTKVVPDVNTRFYFVAIDNARFRKPVEPGDQLMLKVTLKRAFKGIWKFHGLAEVDGVEVASAEIMVAPETKTPKPAGAAG